VAELCTVYYAEGKERQVHSLIDAKELKKLAPATMEDFDFDSLNEKEVSQTVDFLEKFMEANGQWDYIRNQDWYTGGKYVIGIDVNYYPDRSG
jgi:hypothetical protein